MNKFGKIGAISFGLVVLAMALSLIPSHQARGATNLLQVRGCSNATQTGQLRIYQHGNASRYLCAAAFCRPFR
jgi:hypothetical protein